MINCLSVKANPERRKQGHIPFNLISTPLFGRISTWQESHGLLQPVPPHLKLNAIMSRKMEEKGVFVYNPFFTLSKYKNSHAPNFM